MKSKEQYTEEYIKEIYGEDPHYVFTTEIRFSKIGFNAGFSAKEEIIKEKIKDLIENLELTKLEYSQSSGVNIEVVNNYNAEQDRKINLLKILL